MPENKDYFSVRKGVHKKLCSLQKVFVTCENLLSKNVKHLNVNIGFSNFYALRPKWFVWLAQK